MTLYYRETYPAVDDGTANVDEAEEAWHYVRWLRESGYLVPVEGLLTAAEWRDTIDVEKMADIVWNQLPLGEPDVDEIGGALVFAFAAIGEVADE